MLYLAERITDLHKFRVRCAVISCGVLWVIFFNQPRWATGITWRHIFTCVLWSGKNNIMEPLASQSSIKLVVKTPNQRIKDIEVSCLSEWTVEKLKSHLSTVYPTKPVRFDIVCSAFQFRYLEPSRKLVNVDMFCCLNSSLGWALSKLFFSHLSSSYI
jgi:hypothetical protein